MLGISYDDLDRDGHILIGRLIGGRLPYDVYKALVRRGIISPKKKCRQATYKKNQQVQYSTNAHYLGGLA